jgi:hypothetical protein
MSEKEKPKRSTRMGFLRSCLIFSLYPLLILTVLGCGFFYWAIGFDIKSSLDPQYIPTAEYLLERQAEIAATGEYSDFPYQICLLVGAKDLVHIQNLSWAEVYINEQVISRFRNTNEIATHPELPIFYGFCFYGHLDSGLHIIEFRAKENLFAEPYYIQRWAIEIE